MSATSYPAARHCGRCFEREAFVLAYMFFDLGQHDAPGVHGRRFWSKRAQSCSDQVGIYKDRA